MTQVLGRGIRQKISNRLLELILKECYRIAPKHTPKVGAQVEVYWTLSPEIRKLNKQFRNRNSATDVLSFESSEANVLGSIVIDIQTAKKQAREFKHSLQREVCELFVHGIFHLMGFDHIKKEDQKMMARYERRLEKFLNHLDHSG